MTLSKAVALKKVVIDAFTGNEETTFQVLPYDAPISFTQTGEKKLGPGI